MEHVRRPIIPLTLCLATGIAVGKALSVAFFISVPLLVLLLIAAYMLYHHERKAAARIPFILAFFAVGLILVDVKETHTGNNLLPLRSGEFVLARGKVIQPPDERNHRGSMVIEILEINGRSSVKYRHLKASVRYRVKEGESFGAQFREGAEFSFFALAIPPEHPKNPGQFDYLEYLKQQGYATSFFLLHPAKVRIEGSSPDILRSMIFTVQDRMIRVTRQALPEPDAGLLIGLILGRRRELPPQLEEAFKNTGTMHIMAASGLQVTLLTGTLIFLLNLFGKDKIDKRLKHLLVIPVLIFYALLAGASPSIMRATVMGVAYLVAASFERDYDPLNTLFITAFLFLAINPYNLFNIGFQLSFVAVLGIILLFPLIRGLIPEQSKIKAWIAGRLPGSNTRLRKMPGWIATGIELLLALVITTVAAQIILTPILAYYFNQFTLISIVANLILVPLTNFCIIIGLAGGLIGVLLPPAGAGIIWLISLPVKWTSMITLSLGAIPWASITVPSPGIPLMINYYLLLLVVVLPGEWFKKNRLNCIIALLAVAAGFIFAGVRNREHNHRIIFFSTKKHPMVLVDKRGGSMLWVHCKKGRGRASVREFEREILPYLVKNGIHSLELLVITGDRDAAAPDMEDLFDEITVKNLIISPEVSVDDELRTRLHEITPTTKMFSLTQECTIALAGGEVRVFPPDSPGAAILTYSWKNGKLCGIDKDASPESLQQLYYKNTPEIFVYPDDPGTSTAKELTAGTNNSIIRVGYDKGTTDPSIETPRRDGAVIFDISGPVPRKVLWK